MDARFICCLLVLSCLSTGLSLRCHTCFSRNSWADCQGMVFDCQSLNPQSNTCMAVHRQSTYPNGTNVHEFAKTCFTKHLCQTSRCEESSGPQNVTCRYLKCCSTSRCNKGPSPAGKT
ncbi:PREDICTED: uncharacterized protein LOC107335876 isoform X2 [Acropora digitifera]|uniref:uncharacterized protein LOC107335876 isoform X1 n=1 Tax=Acropora digitifera TaxID=70779 RepID=UPI00077A1DEE|nr:PREDICTED: uncharacterized protein LOC107335876 isoform X1 [Acropora digitifera]XP_015756424.1 PREDICTED: uncharacterized protein LOC107335876 isoform X2 [Acropora digitifera]